MLHIKKYISIFIPLILFATTTTAATITVNINLLDASNGAGNQGVLSLKNKNPSSSESLLLPLNREVSQYKAQFTPLITVIPVGSTVTFPNKDEFSHHVYSFSEAKVFESELYKKGAEYEVLFEKPGIVTIGCNIHDWMVSYIYILDTPIYKSTAEGSVNFTNIAAGNYELTFWQPSMDKPYSKDVVIEGDMVVNFDIARALKEVVPFPAPDRTFWDEDY